MKAHVHGGQEHGWSPDRWVSSLPFLTFKFTFAPFHCFQPQLLRPSVGCWHFKMWCHCISINTNK